MKHLNCNDTSMGCAFYGMSILEEIVTKLESYLNSNEYKEKHKWIGNDIKIMGFRDKNKISITMCVPQVSQYVKNIDEYIANKKILKNDILMYVNKIYPDGEIDFYLNTRDKYDENNTDVYLTYTGSSIEMGDEGFVGRGNRIGGLITPRRFYTMEGICGKNPIYHTGKMYCVASYLIAKKINEIFNTNCSVEMIGQSGQSLSNPWKITIYTDKKIDEEECDKICCTILNNFPEISNEIIYGDLPLC